MFLTIFQILKQIIPVLITRKNIREFFGINRGTEHSSAPARVIVKNYLKYCISEIIFINFVFFD